MIHIRKNMKEQSRSFNKINTNDKHFKNVNLKINLKTENNFIV